MTPPYRNLHRLGLATLCLGSALAWAKATEKADFFVAPTGQDQGPGSRDQPFGSLGRARDAVRQALAKGARRSILVYVRGGTYGVAEPLVFGPEDSGTPGRDVTYAAYPGESPILSGGVSLPPFQARGDGVWTTMIPPNTAPPRALFVNGRRATRARHPNSGFLRVATPSADRRSGFSYRAGDIGRIADSSHLEVVLLHDWSISRKAVAAMDATARTLTFAQPLSNLLDMFQIDRFEPHPRFFLEGAAGFLDAPGEWYADQERVYYAPLPGEDRASAAAIIPVAERLLILRGDPDQGRRVRNLVFRGLTFSHTRWDLPSQGYSGIQATFHMAGTGPTDQATRPVPAAIEVVFGAACRFDGVRIAHTGGSGIWFGRGTTQSGLFDSDISDIAGNGVMIGEDADRWVGNRGVGPSHPATPPPIASPPPARPQGPDEATVLRARLQDLLGRYTERHPDVVAIRHQLAALKDKEPRPAKPPASGRAGTPAAAKGEANGPWWQVAPDQAAAGNRVENNRISAVGQVFYGGIGVWVGLARGTRVAHNLIHHLPYSGVSVGWMWNDTPTPARGNVVERNHIQDAMQILSDGGGIYTLGRQDGTLVRDNLIQGIPSASGRSESNGVFADEGSAQIRFENNALIDIAQSPFRFHRTGSLTVERNLLVVAAGQVPYRYNRADPSQVTLQGNRVVAEHDPFAAGMLRRELATITASVGPQRRPGGPAPGAKPKPKPGKGKGKGK